MEMDWKKISDWMRVLQRNDPVRYLIYRVFNKKLTFLEEDIHPYLTHYKRDVPFFKYETYEYEDDINRDLNKHMEEEELEYVLTFDKKCYIEPEYGWIITGNKAFRRSFPYSIDAITPLPHYIYYKRKKKVYLEEGIPLFYNWFNYWHFYNDIIGSMMVIDKLNFDKKIPLIAPAGATNRPYVRDFFTTDYAKKWNWLFVDKRTFVHLNKAYIAKSFTNVKDQFLYAADIFKTAPRKEGNRKIFLNRKNTRGRNNLNSEEILPVIESYGFEIEDTDGMTVFEQKALFEEAAVVLGIHGAGLTNIFFRYPEHCVLLELFPKDFYKTHYFRLAKELGFEYDAISGENNINGSFELDKNKLITFLNKH